MSEETIKYVLELDTNIDTSKFRTAMAKSTMEVEKLKKANKELDKTTVEGARQFERNKTKITQLNTEYKNNAKVVNESIKAAKEEAGSVAQLRAKLAVTTIEWAKLSKAQRENTEDGKKVVAQKLELTNALKNAEEATGDHRRSVGDYAKATRQVKQDINQLTTELKKIEKQKRTNKKLTKEQVKDYGELKNKLKESKTEYKKLSKEQKALSKEQKGGASALSQTSDGMGMLGGSVGRLPSLFKNAMVMAKTFFTVLLSNPIGLILVAIAALIGIAVAVLSKFQPLLDWVSDKIGYVTGLVDGFVESMKNIGDVISAIFSGDFAKANELIGDMGKRMLEVAEANERLTKAMREYEIQAKHNDATTAEVEATQKKLLATYKDESKSIQERNQAFEDFYKEKKAQADADYSAFEQQHNARVDKYEIEKQVALSTADEILKARRDGILTESEYVELMDSRIEVTQLSGKVAEVEAQKAKEANRIRSQALTEQIKLIKERTKYYEATHQSVLEGEKQFTQELLNQEEERLNKIAQMKISAAQKEFETIKANFDKNSERYKSAELKLATEIITIKDDMNKQIISNNEEFSKQQVNELIERLTYFKQINVNALKDTTITTQKELNSRIALHKTIQDEQLNIIRETAEAEKWSATKTKTELLKVEQDFINKKEELTKNLEENTKKTNEEQVKDRQKALARIEQIEQDYLNSSASSDEEYYSNKLNLIDQYYANKMEKLRQDYENQLISKEEFDSAIDDMDATRREEQAEVDNEVYAEKAEQAQEWLSTLIEISNAFIQYNNNERDKELKEISKKYKKEEKLLDDKQKRDEKKLKKKLKDGIISQAQYEKQLEKIQLGGAKAKKDLQTKQEAEEYAAKKKAFEDNKKFQIANVIMNSASALIGTWAGYASMGVAGVILAGIQSALIVGMAAYQISEISNAKMAEGGILSGKLHAQGGIDLGGGIEGEGDEYIINRASTAKYKPMLDAINGAGNGSGNENDVDDIFEDAEPQARRVFVVSEDISDQQDEDIEIENRATLEV